MINKKVYVFGWPAWLNSEFSGNLASEIYVLMYIVSCMLHCLSQINTLVCIIFMPIERRPIKNLQHVA